MGIGENGVNDTGKLPTTLLQNILSEEHEQDDDEFNHYINKTFLEEKRSDDELSDDDELNSMMANASHISYITTLTIKSDTNSQSLIKSNLTYSHYLHFYYEKHLILIELISLYCGSLFGWKEPWIVQSPQKVLRNLKMYQKTYHYPSQSLSSDDNRLENKKYMLSHNKNNILSDSILISTKSNGYWLGNILSGEWYELGIETPHLENLQSAVSEDQCPLICFQEVTDYILPEVL